MLAISHNAISATSMLANCLPTCAQLPSLALYNTTRLVSASNPSASISKGSMGAMKRFHKRLIIFDHSFFSLRRQRLRHLIQQIVVENLACDRRGGNAAVPAVFDQYRQRDLRLVGGGEGDKPGVVAVALTYLARDIFLILLEGDDLRGAGLAGNAVWRSISRHGGSTAGLGHSG